MKEIKTANYIKKFGGGVLSETEGTINKMDGNTIEVTVYFNYFSPTHSLDYLEPLTSSEWEIQKVTDETGRELSDEEIDFYQDQFDRIISDWETNTDTGYEQHSDDRYDVWKDDQLF